MTLSMSPRDDYKMGMNTRRKKNYLSIETKKKEYQKLKDVTVFFWKFICTFMANKEMVKDLRKCRLIDLWD